MIISRMADAIRAQNWFTVIVEIFIVVIGIFLGLQVTEWNEARKERAIERQYLERLHDDLVLSLEDYENLSVQWDNERLRTQDIVLKSLRSGLLKEEDRADFAAGFAYAGRINPPIRRWGTVEELKSTGNIGLIRDIALRNAIAQTEALYERTALIDSRLHTQIFAIRSKLVHFYAPKTTSMGTTGEAQIAFDFEALIRTSEVINLFANIQQLSREAVSFRGIGMQYLEELKDVVEKALTEEETP